MPLPWKATSCATNGSANDYWASSETRLRDTLNLTIAVGVFIAPWYNGDDLTTHGAIRLRLVAVAIGALSLWIMLHQRNVIAEWVNAALGAALITTPCWRGGIDATRVDSAIAGVVIFAFSVSCALQIVRENQSLPGRINLRS